MIQTTLFSVLSPVFSGRLYPQVAPPNAVRPFAVYSRVSSIPATIHGMAAGQESRVQVDIYAETYAAALSLASSAAAAVAASTSLISVPLIEADGFEPETELYRVMLEFAFWH